MIGLLCVLSSAAFATPSTITLPGREAFPESLSSTADGSLYIGNVANGGIVKIGPDGTGAEQWVAPGYFGSASIFGIVVDEKAGMVWACSNDMSGFGIANPGPVKESSLIGFDLATAGGKVRIALPGEKASCNDMAIGPDGSVYVTNISMGEILRLPPGGAKLELWSANPAIAASPDGIAFGGDGNLYVNTFRGGSLYRIALEADGTAGKVSQLSLSRPLERPDGMRSLGGNQFILVEGAGRVARLTVKGTEAIVETLAGQMSGPTGVTVAGDTAWVAEGQLSFLFNPDKKGQQALPFRVIGVSLTRQ